VWHHKPAEGLNVNNKYLSIVSEIRELEDLLATIPEGNVIERMSLESRLQSVKASLAGLPLEEGEGAFQEKRPVDIPENQ